MARDQQRVLEHSARIAERHLRAGQLGRALVVCDGLVKADPAWWRGRVLRAEVLCRLGRAAEAADELRVARSPPATRRPRTLRDPAQLSLPLPAPPEDEEDTLPRYQRRSSEPQV